jgi:hypothetical protein
MLSFTNAPGNLYNRLGKIGLAIKNLKSYQGTLLTTMTDVTNGIVAQFNAESDIQALMGSSYIGIEYATDQSVGGVMQNLAAATANRQIFRDNPRINQTLDNANTLASLQEIIRQMKVAGASILAMTVTAAPVVVGGQPGPHFVGVGNGVINASAVRPLDGLTLENSFAENLLLTCTADSYLGGTAAGNESFVIQGAGNQTDFFAFNWPLGSNGTNGCSAIDGNVDNGSGNILTNGGYNNWTANVPNNYTIATGAATITKEVTLVYDGAAALKLTGDGATLTSWSQQFGAAAGTSGTLASLTQYSFNVFLRRDAIAAGAGTLEVALVDQNGTVIKDANGANNSFTINLTALTTNYANFSGAFRTPEILPTSQFVRYRLTAALTNTRAVYVDKASMGLMTQVYTSGPFAAVHAGSIPFSQGGVQGDYGQVLVTNSRGAGGTLSTFQTLMCQLFGDVLNSELLFPSSPTPNILDASLIA